VKTVYSKGTQSGHVARWTFVPIYIIPTIPVSSYFYTFKICQDYWAWEAKVWAERRSMVIDRSWTPEEKNMRVFELTCLRHLTPRQVSPDRENFASSISQWKMSWSPMQGQPGPNFLSLTNSRHAQRGRLKWCTKIVQGFIGRRVFLSTKERKSVVLDRFRKVIVLGRFRKGSCARPIWKGESSVLQSRNSTCTQQKAFREDEGRLMDWEGARIAIYSRANSPRWLSQLAEPIRCPKRFVVKTKAREATCDSNSIHKNL